MHYLLTSEFTGEDVQTLATSEDLQELQAFAGELETELLAGSDLDEEPTPLVPEFKFDDSPNPNNAQWTWLTGDTEYVIKEIMHV